MFKPVFKQSALKFENNKRVTYVLLVIIYYTYLYCNTLICLFLNKSLKQLFLTYLIIKI